MSTSVELQVCSRRFSRETGPTIQLCGILASMWGIILLLLAIWLVISIIGLVIEGLIWLFIIGAVLFVGTSVWGWIKRNTGG